MTTLDRDIRISTVGRDDYPELEGKLLLLNEFTGEKGIVVGCNRSIGITIVNAEDKDEYCLCFAGPSAPGGVTESLLDDLAVSGVTYDEVFDYTVDCIKNDTYRPGVIADFANPEHSGGICDGSGCAYRQ